MTDHTHQPMLKRVLRVGLLLSTAAPEAEHRRIVPPPAARGPVRHGRDLDRYRRPAGPPATD
jgi:hypothetical protein